MSKHIPENLGQGTLQMFGKQAAAQHIRTGDDLTSCVTSIIKEGNVQVTQEQIKRVCEFANHAAWNHIFDGEDKTAGIPGGPASAEKVSHEVLSSGFQPVIVKRPHSDYTKRPSEIFKSASVKYHNHITGPEYEFPTVEPTEKIASSDNPLMKIVENLGIDHSDIQDQLITETKHAVDHMRTEVHSALQKHAAAAHTLVAAAIDSTFSGTGYIELCGALKQCSPEPWAKLAAVRFMGMGLFQQGLIREYPTAEAFDKVASSGVINTDHLVIAAYHEMRKTAEEYIAAKATLDQLLPIWTDMQNTMREKLAGVADIVGGALGGVGKGMGWLIGKGGNLLAHGGETLANQAVKHPFATTAALGGGVVFGPDIAHRAGILAEDTGNKIVAGVKSGADFGNESPQFGSLYYGA